MSTTMNAKPRLAWPASLLLCAPVLIVAAPAKADCGCPAGKEVLTLAQSTATDKCGLEIVLHAIEKHALSRDVYHIYLKSGLIAMPPGSSFKEQQIPLAEAVNIAVTPKRPAISCTTLVIAGRQGPQKGLVQLQWTYF